jgi:rhomboid protease GluP
VALKPCPACRALIDSGEDLCPYCGASVRGRALREVRLERGETPGLVTGYLIGACVLLFILEMMATLGAAGPGGLWRALVSVPGPILFDMGARNTGAFLAGQWWRIFVPIFLHGGVLHLLFNAMALAQVGPLAEQAYGRSRFLLIFLVAGVVGNVLGLFVYPRGIGVGASGALFGLIGAAGLWGHRRGDAMGLMIRGVMVQWGFYALIFGFLMKADNAAHIGGLVAGFLLSLIVGDAGGVRAGQGRIWTALAAVLVLVTAAALSLAVLAYLAVNSLS